MARWFETYYKYANVRYFGNSHNNTKQHQHDVDKQQTNLTRHMHNSAL